MGSSIPVAAGIALAFLNGANDLSKGIATLVGSGVAAPRRAVEWGVLWTLLGGLAAAIFATAMVRTIGTGLVVAPSGPSHAAAVGAIAGAALWVLLATATGLPVSTTHAIVGAIVGVAVVAYGPEGVRWRALGTTVAGPLLASPLLAVALAAGVRRAMRGFLGGGAAADDCVCIELEPTGSVLAAAPDAAVLAAPSLAVTRGTARSCASDRPEAIRVRLDRVHWGTSAATCFARAMNDAPKIVALVLVAGMLDATAQTGTATAFVAVSVAMAGGSLFAGRRVTRTMGERLARIAPPEGLAANAVTALLVAGGAVAGLPMSTTHVAAGAIAGAALEGRPAALDVRTARDVALAWLVTVPGAAVLGIGATLLVAGLR